MSGSFTTILIEQNESIEKSQALTSILGKHKCKLIDDFCSSGTPEDFAQVFVALLGGFLQQLLGPKKMLLFSSIPNVCSWLLVAAAPHKVGL